VADEDGDGAASRDPLALVEDPLAGYSMWARTTPALRPAFDLVEVGTGPATDASAAGAELAETMRQTDRYPAHLLASSWAAARTLDLVLRRPDLVRGVLLHEPYLAEPDPGIDPASGGALGWRDEVVAAAGADPAGATVAEHLTTLDPARVHDAWSECRSLDARLRWEEYPGPVAVVTGMESAPSIRRRAAAVAARFPNGTLLEVPAAGSFLPLAEPDRFVGIVMAYFLERNVPTT